MKRILITGGSGFIGTNIVSFFLKSNDYEVLNIDCHPPKIEEHISVWRHVDLCDLDNLKSVIVSFLPDYVIHLAARTDLKGECVDDYMVNTKGVENLLVSLDCVPNLQRAIFASSMLVCRVGYIPQHDRDYAPSTFYGKSKVLTENIIHRYPTHYVWSIIRPTSIWGPWFGEPYANFFKMVLNRTYLDLGKHACTKTYGYVENAVYQINSILTANDMKVNKQTFYVGDYTPYNISVWAKEIANNSNITILQIPYILFRVAAKFGDLLKKIHVPFPLTSFRLKNMTTDNILDLSKTADIAPDLPFSRLEGVTKTILWLKSKR